MIQLLRKRDAASPNVLSTRGVQETQRLNADFNNGIQKFTFIKAIYGHKEVKDTLVDVQSGKCCFCESEFRHVSPGDVEHYRPKGGWQQESEPLNQPGYYWLAYDWNNLLLSCSICNRQFKKNLFPLIDESQRALTHLHDLSAEQPLFIHPAFENPEDHIEFIEEYPKETSERGKLTIKKTGLDREELSRRRRKLLFDLKDLYEVIRELPAAPVRNRMINKLRTLELRANEGAEEYSAMLKSFFSKNPIDDL